MVIIATFNLAGENEGAVEPKIVHLRLYQVVKLFRYQVVKSYFRAPEIIKYVGLEATLSLRGPPSV